MSDSRDSRLTLRADVRQQGGEWRVRLGHVVSDEDWDDAVQFLAVLFSENRDGLQD